MTFHGPSSRLAPWQTIPFGPLIAYPSSLIHSTEPGFSLAQVVRNAPSTALLVTALGLIEAICGATHAHTTRQ